MYCIEHRPTTTSSVVDEQYISANEQFIHCTLKRTVEIVHSYLYAFNTIHFILQLQLSSEDLLAKTIEH